MRRYLLIGVLVALALTVVPTALSAFHASAKTGRPAGEGSSRVSGYAVANVAYSLDARDASRIASVTFTLAPGTARSVSVRLAPGGPWYPCVPAGAALACSTPRATVAATTQLSVSAA